MSDLQRLNKKLYNALKLSGFIVRSEFCFLIIDKFTEENLNLLDNQVFDSCLKKLCSGLEQQCEAQKSIERVHVDRAIDACLHSGFDKTETVFSVINAFDFPKLVYDVDRKRFTTSKSKPVLLADADSKSQMFADRYSTVLQRTKRSFKHRIVRRECERYTLQTIDYLLTITHLTLDNTFILGALLQVSEGKWFIEDPTGMVQLDVTSAEYADGYYFENCMLLVTGYYEDKILRVSEIRLPPGEDYKDSRPSFDNLNYFGGKSVTPLRDSLRLQECMSRSPRKIMFFSDVWLDHPLVFEKLEQFFNNVQASPPAAVVFMGSFMGESHGVETLKVLRKLLKQLGEIISRYQLLVSNTHFVFVPSISDPCTPHIVPRFGFPKHITDDMTKYVPKTIFATNPCRMQYYTREMTLFRADLQSKMLQATLHKPHEDKITDCLLETIVSNGHLSPLSLNALPVHWDFDYTLRLYPLPDVVVIGDKTDYYYGRSHGCHVVNPGPFCDGEFEYASYDPVQNTVEREIIVPTSDA